MGIGELLLVAVVGLAIFGGNISINFRGAIRRAEGRELQDGAQAPEQKRPRGSTKKPKR